MIEVAVAVSPSTLVTVNVVELAAAGTVIVLTDKVAAAVFPLATLTTTPPVGAVAFNVTLPVEVVAVPLVRLITLIGVSVTEEIAGGSTVRTAVCCTLL
jgi:hypothetical protein